MVSRARRFFVGRQQTLLLRATFLIMVSMFSSMSTNHASAVDYTITNNFGSAVYANTNFGQTFLVPLGTSGTLTSISNMYLAFRGTFIGKVAAKIYSNPDKSGLLGTSTNECDDSGGLAEFGGVTCSFTFSGVTLASNTSYYFEVYKTTTTNTFFLWQYSGNHYAYGDMYQAGILQSGGYDLQFTINYTTSASPTITSLSTTSGTTLGGTSTTITGTNLTGVTGITFGGTAGTSISSNTSTSVTVTTPAGTAGAKTVVLTTAGGSVTSTGAFTYVAAPTIAYTSYTIAATQNTAITTLTPSNSGGIISSWSISAALPTGLTFSTSSGEFSGTPTGSLSSTPFIVTATNTAGSDTKTVTVSVAALPVPVISYTPSSVSAVIGTAISTLTPANTGETATAWSISPSLPTGLTLNASNGVITGTTTGSSASATYTITATTAAGATGTTTITVSSTAAASTVPDAPTIGTATATGTTTATVTFTAPGSNGGATITTYTATSSPGGITGSISQARSGTISISGLTPGTTYTFTVVATNSVGNSLPSAASNAITTTSSTSTGLVPTFSSVTTGSAGFTVNITNYNASYAWSITVPAPATATLSSAGVITVTGLTGQGTQATVTVTTSRSGFSTESASVTGSTNPAPPPSNYLISLTNSNLSKVNNSYICVIGSYEFIRADINKEAPKISLFIFTLIIDNRRVSQVSTDGAASSVYVSPSTQEYPATATMSQATFQLGIRTDILPAQCEVVAYQEHALNVSNSNILTKKTPSVSWSEILPITSTTKLGSQQLNASADVEGTFTYSVKVGSTLEIGKYSLTVTFTPKDIDNYEVVKVKNSLRVLAASTSIRNLVTIQPPQQAVQIRLSSRTLNVDPAMTLGGKATSNSAGFGIEKLAVSGSVVTVWPVKGFTGRTTLSLVQSGAGGIINIVQPLLVLPTQVSAISATVNSFKEPNLTWVAVAGAKSYQVSLGNRVICTSTINDCVSNTPLGPKSVLSVTAIGNDQAKSIANLTPTIKTDVEAASVTFESGSSALDPEDRNQLLEFAQSIRSLGYTKITVIGHTDNSGGVDNLVLSEARAKSVQKVLQRLLPGVSISVKGRAATEPVASNDTEAGKAKNRRVEIRVSN